MKHYNTIIIGAGLAGCTLGYLLRIEKKNVLIIEKQNIKAKNKLCGGLLTNKSYDLLNKIYGNKNIIKLPITRHNKVTIVNNDIMFEIKDINTYSLYRKELDDFVLNSYIKHGGEILDNVTYDSLDFDNNVIKIGNEEYSFDNVVGADGIFSQLRFDITKRRQKNNFALEILDDNIKEQTVNITFMNNFKGYGWVIPNKDHTLIGIGNVVGNSKIDDDIDEYLDKLKIKNVKKRGAFLPRGNDIFLSYKSNVFFIGDSAGLISPITGEGIYYALYSAYILSKNMNFKYSKIMRPTIRNIKKDLFYLGLVYNDKIRNYLFLRYNKNKFITRIMNKFARHIL
jgi:flavin-dependent dehydrogenase